MSEWRYIRMPKTASTSVSEWMVRRGYPEPQGHSPARVQVERYPGARFFGSYRDPMAWYRSWYGHCLKAGEGNQRIDKTLRAYGRGSTAWRDVLYGLTHPAEVKPYSGDLPLRDHLLNPAGDHLDATEGGLWSRSVRWYFCDDQGRWLVEALLWVPDLAAELGRLLEVDSSDVGRANVGRYASGLEVTEEMQAWVACADLAMWMEARDKRADGYLARPAGRHPSC